MSALVPSLTTALESSWRVLPGVSRRSTRVVLDSFDWRLHRKGVTAEVVGPPGRATTLVLTDGGTRHEAVLAAEVGDRLAVADVPAGPVRDRLASLLDVRVLLPLVVSTTTVRELRVLDERDKTVVRLAVDGDTVRVVPLKGYDGPARDVATALTEAGTAPTTGSDVPRLLDEAGWVPGHQPGTPDPLPTPDMPAAQAVGAVLRAFLDQLEANVPGAVADLDPEFVHDLRIAVRRSRSAIKLAGDVLPSDAAARAARELKWIGDVTTPIRDLDVHLLDLPKLAARLEAYEPGHLDAFAAHLARHRTGEQRTMSRLLGSARYTRFVAWWREVLDGLVGTPEGEPVAALAAARVARADKRVVKLGRAITEESPADDLHTLRKRAKELRYTVDLFSAVLDPAHTKPLISDLKVLQDVLGAFQDSEVQRAALTTSAGAMLAEQTPRRPVPVETLLALGELAGHLKADQDDARAHFAERFERFVRPDVRAHVEALSQVAS